MDLQTLAVSNLLLLCMYAVMTLAYRIAFRDTQPGIKGMDWFIAVNLCLAAEIGLTLFIVGRSVRWQPLHANGLFVPLILVAHLLLHRSFATLLEKQETLWLQQLYTLCIGLAVWGAVLFLGIPMGRLVFSLISGIQFSLIATMLFSLHDRDGRIAGWLSCTVTGIYALYHFASFMAAALKVNMWRSHAVIWPTEIQLLANGAITFSFILMAASLLQVQTQREAEVDELTGLMNRRGMQRAAARIFSRCRHDRSQLSVITIDLDALKKANDRLGHGAGDVLLRSVGVTLLRFLRRGDTVARMGGDEFCLLLPGARESEAILIAERFRLAFMETSMTYQGEKLHVSASFGIASTEDCSIGWEEMLRRSDAAMYAAKDDGGNRVSTGERDQTTSWRRGRNTDRELRRVS